MGRTKAYCKFCRREGEKLFLKGDRCSTPKCAIDKRKTPPGQHGAKPVKITEYGKRLREKQKARRIYGIGEKQFENYFKRAVKMVGASGEKLLELLERRIDNVIFRLGFAASRSAARQIVRHGHVSVNGRRVNIPSFQVREGNEIFLDEASREAVREKLAEYTPPSWLLLNKDSMVGRVVHLPRPEDTERIIEEALIVEYYSR